ncbi:MAG: hypothetical protein KC419_12450 [Anaerolineales bacterium]|nr:hypothetical protein [Anaerolineales bacterium]
MRNFRFVLTSIALTLLAGGGLFGLVYFGLAGVTQAAPAVTTWYVNSSTGSDANNCLSAGTACATIKTAVSKAADDDIINIATGTYLEHDIEIGKRLTLVGAGADNTTIDGSFDGRVFKI